MAVVTVASIQITDFEGSVKSIPLYFDNAVAVAAVALYLQEIAPLVEAAIDGRVTGLSVTLGVDLPGGLKGAATAGNTVGVGALLAFDVANSNFSHSIYVPTWEAAGFSQKVVVNTGVYAALITALSTDTTNTTDGPTSEEGNDLGAFLKGRRSLRK